MQAFTIIASDLQAQINDMTSGSGGNDPDVGTMLKNIIIYYIYTYIYIYIQICGCEYLYISKNLRQLTHPMHFSKSLTPNIKIAYKTNFLV